MTQAAFALPEILRYSPVDVLFGSGAAEQAGLLAQRLGGGRRVLLVSHSPVLDAGPARGVLQSIDAAGVACTVFANAEPNPTTRTVDAVVTAARGHAIGVIVGLGGGSAMDCAKGANLILTNGGSMADYRGDAPADVLSRRKPLLPMILIPTTAGTGSEAQSFALISDATTHMKLACGDRRPPAAGGLRPRVAILDAQLTRSQPAETAAASAMDAISHAVETAGCRARTGVSREFSRAAWELLAVHAVRAVRRPEDAAARSAMLLGAHLAGCAIENSMLGAAHACANPLAARFGITHGIAVGLLLPHVVRFNASSGPNPYADLVDRSDDLAAMIGSFLADLGSPQRLSELGVPREALPVMAGEAASQWTAGFNPRPAGSAELLTILDAAY
ncbi:MAG: iron-containing alcohol dehydrogenase [Planctomycetes bacterium]|nr:iron-containing alcohol dehydrogenase [Planctomycetota bacterium]